MATYMYNMVPSLNVTLLTSLSDSNATNGTHLDLLGYLGMVVASVLWGSNNLPIKHYETGDGMFFQFIVGIAIWQTGIIIHWVRGFPKFYAGPLLGGFFWATGNVQTVPAIRCVGIGVGSLFWNLVGLVVGWSYARFGWFGLIAQIPSNITLNYMGVVLAVISCFIFLFVKVEEHKLAKKLDEEEQDILNESIPSPRDEISYISNEIAEIDENAEADLFDRLTKTQKRIVGVFCSTFAGFMFGFSYLPADWILDNVEDASQNQNDYAFSMSCGIFLTSTLYFLIYCIVMKNKPKVYAKLIFPSLVTGWLWGIANTAYFIATDILTQSITFPLANSGPAVVAFILALLYREIKGRNNLLVLAFGLAVAIAGIICTGLSF